MTTLSLGQFFGDLAVVEATAYLDENTSRSESGNGTINRAAYGTRLWRGDVRLSTSAHEDADRIDAKLQLLREADVSFDVSPAWRRSAPVGAAQITGILSTDRRIITVDEELLEGEWISLDVNGLKSMHRVVLDRGTTYSIVPALPLAVSVSQPITRGRPVINAVLDRTQPVRYRGSVAAGIEFSWIQNLS